MTREEAIEIINEENDPNDKSVWEVFPEYREALDMAIKALEQEPTYYPPCIDCNKKMDEIRRTYDKLKEQEPKTGHWINSNIPNEEYVCSECGGACWYYDYQAKVAKSKLCPNCGARMVEPQESEHIGDIT